MELHQLRYFVAIAECGSFRRAAARCHVAQPSLSQQIAKLEAGLDRRLFDRLGRGVALTEAGAALLPRAQRILAAVREAASEVQEDIAAGRGRLAVGAIPTVAPYLLPPAIRRFRKAFPRAELSIVEDLTDALLERLVSAEIDLCLLSLPIDNPQVEVMPLLTEALLVVAPAGHALAAAPAPTLQDLKDEATVVLHEMHCLGEQIQAFCHGHGVGRSIVCRTTQLSTVQRLVALGMGVSLVPEMCARQDRSRRRIYRPLADGSPRRSVVVAWHRGRSRSRLAEGFVEVLKRERGSGRR